MLGRGLSDWYLVTRVITLILLIPHCFLRLTLIFDQITDCRFRIFLFILCTLKFAPLSINSFVKFWVSSWIRENSISILARSRQLCFFFVTQQFIAWQLWFEQGVFLLFFWFRLLVRLLIFFGFRLVIWFLSFILWFAFGTFSRLTGYLLGWFGFLFIYLHVNWNKFGCSVIKNGVIFFLILSHLPFCCRAIQWKHVFILHLLLNPSSQFSQLDLSCGCWFLRFFNYDFSRRVVSLVYFDDFVNLLLFKFLLFLFLAPNSLALMLKILHLTLKAII